MDSADKVSTVCEDCGGSLAFDVGTTQVRCTFCDSGMAVGQGTRLVRLQCPACSGNFYYIDGLMGGQCPYCDTALLALTRHRVLRFVIRPTCPSCSQGSLSQANFSATNSCQQRAACRKHGPR